MEFPRRLSSLEGLKESRGLNVRARNDAGAGRSAPSKAAYEGPRKNLEVGPAIDSDPGD